MRRCRALLATVVVVALASVAGVGVHAQQRTRVTPAPLPPQGVPFTAPTTYVTVYEDFLESTTGVIAAGAGTSVFARWRASGTFGGPTAAVAQNGVVRVDGDAANNGALMLNSGTSLSATAGYLAISATTRPTWEIRWAQFQAGASTRRCGFADAILAAAPADGLYLEHTAGGSVSAIIRSGGATVFSVSGLYTAAADTFHVVRVVVDSTTNVSLYVDGVLSTTTGFPQILPVGNLTFSCSTGAVTANAGLWLDYLWAQWVR